MINLFVTPLKIINLNNYEQVNEKINECCRLGFENNFNEKLPKEEKESIEKIFREQAELYLKELTNKQVDLYLQKSWVNNINKYEFNTPHDHCDNTVIAVYYINAPHNSGDLLLHDPRGANSFVSQFELNNSGTKVSGRSYYRIKAETGSLVLFPSYIVHSVEPNMSDEIRRSLAINFRYKNFNQFK